MAKKVEVYRFGTDGIPKELAERIRMPSHIEARGHPLRPYLDEKMTRPGLDLILLEDLNGFYQKLEKNPFGFMSFCSGLYLAKNHIWMPKEEYERINDALKREYGIDVERGLLLSQENVNYWTMVHEALHDVFNHLSPEQRAKIIQSAISSYNSSDKLYDMLGLTHLNTTNFPFDLDETARIMGENGRMGRSPLDGFDDFYTFGNLQPVDRLQVADEFISNFFTNNRGKDRWSRRHLSSEFRMTLFGVGYNMLNPPEIEY